MAKAHVKAVIIFCALLVGVCFTLAQEPQVAQPPPPIDFPDWKEVSHSDTEVEYTLRFASAFETPYPVNNFVPLRVILPAKRNGPVPVVILLHYWGARDFKIERSLAGELIRHGYGAVLVTLPYHMTRTPAGSESGQLALQPEPSRMIATMTQSIWDIRRTVDWAATRLEIDPNRIGIAGTSLGAVVATLAYALEPRITHAAFMLGGVDVAHIIWSSARTVRERDALRRQGYTEGRLRDALQPIEPLNYLSSRRSGHAFVIGANYDTVIPHSSTMALVRAFDHPQTLFVDTGHYGGMFAQRRLLREVGNFFAAEFEGKEFAPPSRIYAPTVRIGATVSTGTGFDLSAGLDLLRFDRRGLGFASLLITPRGPRLFIGRNIDSRIAVGFFGSRTRSGFGLLWSIVL